MWALQGTGQSEVAVDNIDHHTARLGGNANNFVCDEMYSLLINQFFLWHRC